jgi:hypothetical protein
VPKVPYTRLTTAQFNALASSTLGSLKPYQLRQVDEYLDRVNWGKANNSAGRGSDSDVGAQPTIAQILTLVGSNPALATTAETSHEAHAVKK